MTRNLSELNHLQAYFVEEFAEDYKEGQMSRRDMLKRVLAVTGSMPLAAGVLLTLGCGSDSEPTATATKPAGAATVPATVPSPAGTPTGPGVAANDPAIKAEDVKFTGQAGQVLGYMARPATGGPFAGVIVIHENRGLVDQTKDVARRFAKEGFAALAVDLVSRRGGTTPENAATIPGVLSREITPAELTQDLVSGVGYLKTQSFVKPNAIGVTGYCFGGAQTWALAIASPDIKAAVPYYGSLSAEQMDQLGKTNAAVLAIYGGNDTRITSQAPDVEARLKAAGKTVQTKVYEGANHAFFNDTGGSYNPVAAADAWVQTLAWFRKYLTG